MTNAIQETLDQIHSINLYDIVLEIEEDLRKYNEEWEWSAGGDVDIQETLENLLGEMPPWSDMPPKYQMFDCGFMWQGMLTEFPWCELNMSEDGIIDWITAHHLHIQDHRLRFRNNTMSPLYRFFLEHRDGYGGNIPYSVGNIMRQVSDWIVDEIKENLDRYGTWYPLRVCPECHVCFYTNLYVCPECNVEFEED